MPKILKGKPLPHVVVIDTNILWHKDKSFPVNPDFDTFWADHKSLVELELKIPEVVRGELLFQQATSCVKLLDKVTEQIEEISSIASARHKHRITKDKIKEQVTAKIDRWLKSKDAEVVPTPISSIDWNTIIQSAIWRHPPFSSDPKNPDTEKGFRDSLIAETVLFLVANESRAVNFAFLCNDFLLRSTVAKALKADQRFACYESLADFSSYIKLTREQLTNEFIKKIVQRAGEKFYKENDPTCLWNKENILQKLTADRSRFEIDDFNLPIFQNTMFTGQEWRPTILQPTTTGIDNPSPVSAPSIYQSAVTGPLWTRVGENKWMLGTHAFEKVTNQRTYHWKRPVTYICRYRATYGAVSEMKGLLVRFNVLWKADVKDDARFQNIALEEVQFETREFRPLTDDENKRLGFAETENTQTQATL